MKTNRRNRTFLVVLLILSMLAAEFSAAGIPAHAVGLPSVGFSGNEQPDGLYITLNCYNFDDIANFSMQITYDPAVLRYISYEADPMLRNALVSVNASNGKLILAFVSTTELQFSFSNLITFRFELLNAEPTYTEIHGQLLECTDSLLNPKNVSCNEYTGFWIKNNATTNYEPTLSSDYNVPLYADASVYLGFSKNGGFYAGSFTVTYNPTQLEFVGCAFAQAYEDMTINFTDAGDETNGVIKIAFAGTQLYSDIGQFLEIIFVPKVAGWCWYSISDLTLTNANLQDVRFDYGIGSDIYVTDTTADNYFSISNAATVTTGDTFDVVIDLNNNAGFAALTGALLYDSSLFEFVKAEFNADTVGGALSSVTGATSGEVRFGVVSTSLVTGSGELLTITLRAIANSEETSNLELDIIELVDTVGIPVPYATDVGSIKVTLTHVHEWVATAVIPPTCTQSGYTHYTCKSCGDSYAGDFVGTSNHIYEEGFVTAPTCTTDGYTTYICSVCGDSYMSDFVSYFGHSYEAVVTPPTCTAQGYTIYTCSVCGDSYISDYTNTVDHSFESVVIPPTCAADGYTIYTCSVCGYSEYRDYVSSPGHSYETVVTPPTCTADGYTTYICTFCGYSERRDPVGSLGHSYEAFVTPPTCTADGYTIYTCGICGDSYVGDFVSFLGHSYEAFVTPPTCTEQGYTIYTCGICGDSYINDFVSASHSYETVVTPPTCTEQGYTTHTCSVCGDTFVDDFVGTTDHIYEAVVTAPTCTEDGYTTHTCSVCGASYRDNFVSASHSYETAVTPPTCTEQGYTTHTCSVCGDTFVDDFVVTTDHIYEAVVTAPTCTEQGYTTYTCSVCGASYRDNFVSASHSYEAVVTAPTCTETGITTYTCHCGDSYTEQIAALGHDYVDGECIHCGEPEVQTLLGDVNGDGRINTSDAKLIMQYELRLIDETKLNLAAADVNGDGRINTSDAKLIMQYELKLISQFPAAK